MRAMTGMAYGALIGLAAGVASALVLAVGLGIVGLVSEDAGAAVAIFLIYAFFGSMVAAVVGSLVGAIAGVVLGAVKAEAHAPVAAALTIGGATLLFAVLLLLDAERPETRTLQAFFGVFVLVIVLAFAAIGYAAGVAFAKVTVNGPLGSRSPTGPYAGDETRRSSIG